VPPRDWGIDTTIAKDAQVQIRNDIVEFIAMVQSQNWRGRVDESLFLLGGNWHAVWVSKVGVELIDTFLDLTEHFLFEG
jgi:hypothetical protein